MVFYKVIFSAYNMCQYILVGRFHFVITFFFFTRVILHVKTFIFNDSQELLVYIVIKLMQAFFFPDTNHAIKSNVGELRVGGNWFLFFIACIFFLAATLYIIGVNLVRSADGIIKFFFA